ncbi:MAG: trigger factor [Deltaproteobacteria bacterium]|nr:trigger factor [Deltaproteobacteria bacterium]
MKVAVEELSQAQKRLSIDIPADEVDREISDAYRKLQASARIDGFRMGKVPMSVLEKRYGSQLLDEVSTRLIENSFPTAMKDKGISPVAMPRIEAKAIERGKPFSYDAMVEVGPNLNPEGYVGMAVREELGKEPDITDADISEVLDRLREQRAEFNDVERGAEDGDLLFLDFTSTVDGEELKDSHAEDYMVKIGEKSMLPGFEDALVGLKKGDTKEIKLTLPYDFHEVAIAGKEAAFNVTVKSVKEKVLHKVDDEFAKDIECESLDDLKSKVRESIVSERKAMVLREVKEKVVEELIAKNSFDLPESLLKRYVKPLLERADENLKKGAPAEPEDAHLSQEALENKYTKVAESQLRRDMLMDAIAVKEKITVSPEEIETKIAEVAKESGESVEKVKENIEEQKMTTLLKKSLLDEKVFTLILSKAV